MYKNYWGFLFLYFEEWPCLFSRQESFSPVKPLPVRPLTARSRQEVLHLLLLFYFDLHQLTSMYTYTFSPVYICPVRHPLHSNSLLFPPPSFFVPAFLFSKDERSCCGLFTLHTCIEMCVFFFQNHHTLLRSISLCLRVWLVLIHSGRRICTDCPPFHLDIPKTDVYRKDTRSKPLKPPSKPRAYTMVHTSQTVCCFVLFFCVPCKVSTANVFKKGTHR